MAPVQPPDEQLDNIPADSHDLSEMQHNYDTSHTSVYEPRSKVAVFHSRTTCLVMLISSHLTASSLILLIVMSNNGEIIFQQILLCTVLLTCLR